MDLGPHPLVLLPQEVIELLLDFCDPATACALHGTCADIRGKTAFAHKSWRRICLNLDIQDWKTAESDRWVDVFGSYVDFRHRVRTLEGLRVVRSFQGVSDDGTVRRVPSRTIDLDASPSRSGGDSPALKKVLKYVSEKSASCDLFTRSQTVAYALSQEYFVIAHSFQNSGRSTLVAWRNVAESPWQRGRVTRNKSESPRPICDNVVDFEIPAQHAHVWRHFFVAIPFRSSRHFSALLNFYDIEDDLKLALAHENETGLKILRDCPSVYKESGANRIYSHGSRIALVDATPGWKIRVFEALEKASPPGLELTTIFCISLSMVKDDIPDPFFCSDQTDAKLALAFFTKIPDAPPLYPNAMSTVVTLNMETGAVLFIDPGEFKFFRNVFNVFSDVAKSKIQAFLLATAKFECDTDVQSSFNEEMHEKCIPGRRIQLPEKCLPVLVAFTATARIFVMGEEPKSRRNPMLKTYSFLKKDWIFNELVVSRDTITILQRFVVNRVIYALDFEKLDLLWNIELDSSPHKGLHVKPPMIKLGLNKEHRFYMHYGHGLVWLADAAQIIFLDRKSGAKVGQIPFPDFKRHLPELYDDIDEDTTPYAQMGFSVWQLAAFGAGKIVVVHDMERRAPLVFDAVVM